MSIKNSLLRNLANMPGFRTKEQYIIFESDDWGSIRMPSLRTFETLENKGLDLRSSDAERYNLNDTLESEDDLKCLFEVLSKHKDIDNNSAVFTPITIVANPDFQKIRNAGFQEYFYEPFTKTYKRYPGCENSFELWKEGLEKGLFIPQMHGREHLNVLAWMNALRSNELKTIAAFNEGVWGFVPDIYPEIDYQAAFQLSDPYELIKHENIIIEGLELFKNLFGYAAEYFVPPNGIINNSLNNVLFSHGIKYRYASKLQHETYGRNKSRRVIHWLGQKDKTGIRYIVRNCFFEPSQKGRDWTDSCLNDIKIAFRWKKPAIISSHRVNYIGSLNSFNRDNGLKQLEVLLDSILKYWPDVHFITTSDLGKYISKKSE